jgi:hypothetical protein
MNYDKEKLELYLTNGVETVISDPRISPTTRLYVACIAEDRSTAFAIAAEVLKLLGDVERVSVEALTHPMPIQVVRGSTRLVALVTNDVLQQIAKDKNVIYGSLKNSLLVTSHVLGVNPLDLIIEVDGDSN